MDLLRSFKTKCICDSTEQLRFAEEGNIERIFELFCTESTMVHTKMEALDVLTVVASTLKREITRYIDSDKVLSEISKYVGANHSELLFVKMARLLLYFDLSDEHYFASSFGTYPILRDFYTLNQNEPIALCIAKLKLLSRLPLTLDHFETIGIDGLVSTCLTFLEANPGVNIVALILCVLAKLLRCQSAGNKKDLDSFFIEKSAYIVKYFHHPFDFTCKMFATHIITILSQKDDFKFEQTHKITKEMLFQTLSSSLWLPECEEYLPENANYFCILNEQVDFPLSSNYLRGLACRIVSKIQELVESASSDVTPQYLEELISKLRHWISIITSLLNINNVDACIPNLIKSLEKAIKLQIHNTAFTMDILSCCKALIVVDYHNIIPDSDLENSLDALVDCVNHHAMYCQESYKHVDCAVAAIDLLKEAYILSGKVINKLRQNKQYLQNITTLVFYASDDSEVELLLMLLKRYLGDDPERTIVEAVYSTLCHNEGITRICEMPFGRFKLFADFILYICDALPIRRSVSEDMTSIKEELCEMNRSLAHGDQSVVDEPSEDYCNLVYEKICHLPRILSLDHCDHEYRQLLESFKTHGFGKNYHQINDYVLFDRFLSCMIMSIRLLSSILAKSENEDIRQSREFDSDDASSESVVNSIPDISDIRTHFHNSSATPSQSSRGIPSNRRLASAMVYFSNYLTKTKHVKFLKEMNIDIRQELYPKSSWILQRVFS